MLRRLFIALGLLGAIALGAFGSWNLMTANAGAETDASRLVGLVAFGLAAMLFISTRFAGRFWTLRLVLLVLIAIALRRWWTIGNDHRFAGLTT